MKPHVKRCGLVLALSLILVAPQATAQLGPAFSGLNASARDATTAYWNPAGLTRVPNTQLVVIGSIAYGASQFRVKEGTTVAGGDPKDGDGFVFIPSVYLSLPLAKKWRTGFALNIPTVIGTDYGDAWSGRYIATDSSLIFVNFSPVVAYRLHERFSLGAGLNIIYTRFESEAAINNVPERLPDGKVKYDGDSFSVGFSIGGLFEWSPRTRFGLTYQSETEPELSATPEFNNLGPVRRRVLDRLGLLGQDINADTRTPQSLRGGVYHAFNDRWSVTGDIIWVDFASLGWSRCRWGRTRWRCHRNSRISGAVPSEPSTSFPIRGRSPLVPSICRVGWTTKTVPSVCPLIASGTLGWG